MAKYTQRSGAVIEPAVANDRQVGGTHYQSATKSGQQHWDMAWDFNLDFFQYQVSRYLFRWRRKGGIQDLEKARHFLDKYIECIQKEVDASPVEGKER